MTGIIYKITNKSNNKSYIGKTHRTLKRRVAEHIHDSKRERCKNRPLYRAFNKYGTGNFEFSVLGVFNEKDLSRKEQEFIELYDTYKNGYNATLGGDGIRYLEIDENYLIDTYKNTQSLNKTSKIVGCDLKTVQNILINNNIEIINYALKPVRVVTADKTFNSVTECAEWVVSNGLSRSNDVDSVRKGLTIPLQTGKKKYGMIFEYVS